MADKKDIIVVGAGPAGLVAAINLNREGYNVILRERQDVTQHHIKEWAL